MTAGWPQALADRPVCPHRGLPIPFIAEVRPDGTGEFTVLDNKRAIECMQQRLCAMCGGPMGSEVALIGDRVSQEPDGFFIEPPVHEHCGELAVGGLCPFLSRERVPRRPVQPGTTVVGDRADLAGVGRPGKPKRPVIMAVCADYYPGLVPTDTGGEVIAYRPRGVLRVRRYAYVGDRLAEIVPGPPRPPARVIRQQPRRRPRSKR